MSKKINWDALGVGTSVACAIHCLLLPLFVASLPVFGINIVSNRKFEYLMIFIAFAIGALAMRHGYQKHHKRFLPLLVFSAGILLLLLKQQWHEMELWILPFAVGCIIWSHVINFKLSRAKAPKQSLSDPFENGAAAVHGGNSGLNSSRFQ